MGLCLFANNHVIDHEENRMIDQNKKPTAVSLAGVMRKGENEVGLLRFYKNVKYCILEAMYMRRLNCSMTFWFSLRHIAFKMTLGETVVRGLLSAWRSGVNGLQVLGENGYLKGRCLPERCELKRLLYGSLRFKCPSNIRKLHIANMPC